MSDSAMIWTGRLLSGVFALFMLGASAAPKLMGMPVAEEIMVQQLGWPPGYTVMIGLIELTCVVLYTLFSIYLGLFMWGGLWLRNPALRSLFPLRSNGLREPSSQH